MGAFKELMIEVEDLEIKLGRPATASEIKQIENEYVKSRNEYLDDLNTILGDACEEICEKGGI